MGTRIERASHLTQTAAVRANESAPDAVHKYLVRWTHPTSPRRPPRLRRTQRE